MVNNINSKTGLMAVVLFGMTMSYAPVQAGVRSTVLEKSKKVVKIVYKAAKIGGASILFVGGAVWAGCTLDPANNNTFINSDGNSFRGMIMGAGVFSSILGAIFLYKELFSDNSNEQKKDNNKES